MSLHRRTLYILAFLMTALCTLGGVIQWSLVYPAFEGIERETALSHLDRIKQQLDQTFDDLSRITYDWSSWDDTYRFMEDGNEEYRESNLAPDSFSNLDLEFAYFLDRNQQIIWGERFAYDSVEDVEVITTPGWSQALLLQVAPEIERIDLNVDMDEQVSTGFVRLGNQLLMIAVRPISTSDGSAPHRGFLVMGRDLSEERLAGFQRRLGVAFELSGLPHVEASEVQRLNRRPAFHILSDDLVQISEVLFQNNAPVAELQVSVPREITQQAYRSIHLAIALAITASLCVLLITWWLLRRHVITPIQALTRDMQDLASSEDLSRRSSLEGNHEIGQLATSFNQLMQTIESTQKTLKKTEAELIVANMELNQLSQTDGLTGVPNKRAFDTCFEETWQLLTRLEKPLALLVIDIDLFKQYNDSYGHQQGDECLRQVAMLLQLCLRRANDRLARIGGEEFAILLPATGLESAREFAEQICQRVRAAKLPHRASHVSAHVTVSVGVSAILPTGDTSKEHLFRVADHALYQAKQDGRNRYCVAAA